MSVLAETAYRQVTSYWANPVEGGFGDITYDGPTYLNTKWEDRIETFIDLSGVERRSKAIVFVQTPLEVGGYLYKGTSVASDPTTVANAWKIQRFDEIPDLRGLNVCYRAFV